MMYPIIEQISDERDERARVEVKYDKVCERVVMLEKLLSAQSASAVPECVEEIQNKLADLQTQQKADVLQL